MVHSFASKQAPQDLADFSAEGRPAASGAWGLKVVFGLAFALALSFFFLLVTYPGTLSPDSVASWAEARNGQFSTIKPPFLGLVQSAYLGFFSIETAVAAFSLTQGVLFWFSIFFLLACIIRGGLAFALGCLSFLVLIPLWSYATVHWTDVWVSIFLVFSFAFFELFRQSDYRRYVHFALGVACLVLAASTRHNAASVLPVVMLPLLPLLKRSGRGGALPIIGIGAVIIPALFLVTKLFLLLPQVHVSPSLAPFGLLNQYLGAIAHSPEDRKPRLLLDEAPLFDQHFGSGSLVAAVEAYQPKFNGKLVWGPDSILRFKNQNGFETVLQNGDFVTRSFLRIAAASPEGFLRHKGAYLAGQFGTGSFRVPLGTGIHTNELGLEEKPVLKDMRTSLSRFLRANSKKFPYQHWFSFAVGLAAVLINLFVVRAPLVNWLFAGAALYALPYVVFETGWEWRYLMPSYVLNFLAAVAVARGVVEQYPLRAKISQSAMFRNLSKA